MKTLDQLIDDLTEIRNNYSGDMPVTYCADMPPEIYDGITCAILDVDCYDDAGRSASMDTSVVPTRVCIL